MTLELMLMQAAVEDRRRELNELLRHAGYDTRAEAARQRVARRPLARLRRVLPRLRVQRRQPA